MKLIIKIYSKEVKIYLLNKSSTIDEISFPEERNLSEKLLPEIDKILTRNKLEPKDVAEMKVSSNQSDSFTTTRIAQSVAKAFNWAVLHEN